MTNESRQYMEGFKQAIQEREEAKRQKEAAAAGARPPATTAQNRAQRA